MYESQKPVQFLFTEAAATAETKFLGH